MIQINLEVKRCMLSNGGIKGGVEIQWELLSFVLYNVVAHTSYEVVSDAVRAYAESKGVHVTFTKLLKRRENRGKASYIMRVNLIESDFVSLVENDEYFWSEGVYWRDYVPY